MSDGNVSCPICFCEYDNEKHIPIVERCGHSVCHQCRVDVIKQSHPCCCLCRNNIIKKSPFVKNFLAKELLELIRKKDSKEKSKKAKNEELEVTINQLRKQLMTQKNLAEEREWCLVIQVHKSLQENMELQKRVEHLEAEKKLMEISKEQEKLIGRLTEAESKLAEAQVTAEHYNGLYHKLKRDYQRLSGKSMEKENEPRIKSTRLIKNNDNNFKRIGEVIQLDDDLQLIKYAD